MKKKNCSIYYRLMVLSLLVSLILIFEGCKGGKNEATVLGKPAEVINPVKETSLTTVKLTSEAEQRLGIETVEAEVKHLPQILAAGGEIMALPGQDVNITAPVSGTVVATTGGYFPVAGSIIKKGDQLMRLIILPPETEIISATEAVRVRSAEYEVALAEKERAEELYNSKALSEKNYELAVASLVKAEASLSAAKGKVDLYLGKDLEAAAKNLSTYTIESPLTGVVQNIAVTPGQSVPATSVLAEISPTDKFWIRVSLFSGDLAGVDRKEDAIIATGGIAGSSSNMIARPIEGPRRSEAISSSSELYYSIDNNDRDLRAGQRVSVTLHLKNSAEAIVIPYSSIVYDTDGGTWVYVMTEPLAYVRKRVEMSYVSGSLAVITRGVSSGEKVVFCGVAELYGTEFGGGK